MCCRSPGSGRRLWPERAAVGSHGGEQEAVHREAARVR
jgi:hypothetical protein